MRLRPLICWFRRVWRGNNSRAIAFRLERFSTVPAYKIVFFIALLSAAVALGGGLAHAFALPNKINLPAEAYFTVQQSYRGWNRLGFLLPVELGAMIAVAIWSRAQPATFVPVLLAIGCVLAGQLLFWVYTFPANSATHNWTTIPANWQTSRRNWEYSHAASAGLQLLAVASLIIAALARTRP